MRRQYILDAANFYMHLYRNFFMPVSDVNTEEACQIAVSQAMKHMRPDSEPELLSAEDHFASEATRSEVWYFLSMSL